MKVVVIGVHGPAFSGKDEVLKLLKTLAPKDTVVIEARFADPMYEMLRPLLPLVILSSDMPKEEKHKPRPELGGLSIRQALIAVGEGFRGFQADAWCQMLVERMFDQIDDVPFHKSVVVICPDLRRENEAWALREIPQRETPLTLRISPVNSPVNEHHHGATESPIPRQPRDVEIINDHAKGLPAYWRSIVWALAGSLSPSDLGVVLDAATPMGDADALAKFVAERRAPVNGEAVGAQA